MAQQIADIDMRVRGPEAGETRPSRSVRLENMGDVNRRRYFDPRDGRWTLPQPDGASVERYNLRRHGWLLRPPGDLYYYVNPKLEKSVELVERLRAADGLPYPAGPKTTGPCNHVQHGGGDCETWEQHYEHLGLEKRERYDPDRKNRVEFTTETLDALTSALRAKGLVLVREDQLDPGTQPGMGFVRVLDEDDAERESKDAQSPGVAGAAEEHGDHQQEAADPAGASPDG